MKMKKCLKAYKIDNLAIMSITGKMKENSKLKRSNKYVCILQASLKRKGIQEGKIMKTKCLIYKKDMHLLVLINKCSKCIIKVSKVQLIHFKLIIQDLIVKVDI